MNARCPSTSLAPRQTSALRAQRNTLGHVTRTELEAALDRARAELVRAVEPLTDEQSRRRLVPSLTTPIALLKHCAAAERVWFQRTIGGIEESRCDGYARGDDGGWMVPESQTLAEVIAEFEAACARSREIAKTTAMDDVFEHRLFGSVTYSWICLHMIAELGRHAGHADILVEQILAADSSH